MVASAHMYDIFIAATPQQVWDAVVDGDATQQYFHQTRIESSFTPGEKVRYVIASNDVDAVEGTVETFEPPKRFCMTWRVLYDEAMSAEPPSRVEWTIAAANDDATVSRVTLRHAELALSPLTWENVRLGWVQVLDGLKTWLETGGPMPDVDIASPEVDAGDVEGHWHRAQAVTANNSVWELLDGRSHTASEADELLQRAYAAAYHWNRATGASVVNQARASWLVSRAHAVLAHGELALHHADRTMGFVNQAGDDAADFDVAYAHEARARSLACLGRTSEASEAYARAIAVQIADDQDRAILVGDLAAEPWFGLDRS